MEINIRIAGAAGQGMQTAADLLGKGVTRSGWHVIAYSDAESRIRGGLNFNHLRVSDQPCAGVTNRVDILVALTREAVEQLAPTLTEGGVILCSEEREHPRRAPLNLAQLAEQAGSKRVESTVAVALVAGLIGLDSSVLEPLIHERFGGDAAKLEPNLKAMTSGYAAAQAWSNREMFVLPPGDGQTERLWLAGHEALALGAVAGGVTFFAGYPMSPATAIFSNLGDWQKQAGIVIEQSEDEIAAINMVAGAAYAGARAMTATSGGGFALMVEGLSLLGMIEAPAVIVLGQRPGPATGLPTRTAQGDLNFARFAGHGSFPRILLAPSSVPDCINVTAYAFDLAERFQVPVIVLTDQLQIDTTVSMAAPSFAEMPRERYLLTPEALRKLPVYRRYEQAESGLSPMAAPGDSHHTVVVDSDEHDEEGHMTESGEVAERMVRKRLRKAASVEQAAWAPDVTGEVEGRPLVITWGSCRESVAEALAQINANGAGVAHMNLRWLWPLPAEPISAIVNAASSITVVENSPEGGLVSVLREVTLRKVDHEIRSVTGRPFAVEYLIEQLTQEVMA
ncbi:MAG: 2-oxoacid:acceptor oxidoreductase subunit alpha [Kiritimatiellae bacterium]|nr:2-oxoacid:acceptor oxidoreductase subunit alpha [Kiritimatiellia bacterium]